MNSWSLDRPTMLGMTGQLAGHGLVWAKQVASGAPLGQVLSTTNLFWAAFNIASETLTTTASDYARSSTAGILAPAAVQVAVLNSYDPETHRVLGRVASGDLMAVSDSPFLAGVVGSVIAKSYA